MARPARPPTPKELEHIGHVFGPVVRDLAACYPFPAVCRTMDEIAAAAALDSLDMPPLTQAQADRVAAILAPYGIRIGGGCPACEAQEESKLARPRD